MRFLFNRQSLQAFEYIGLFILGIIALIVVILFLVSFFSDSGSLTTAFNAVFGAGTNYAS